MGSDCLGESSSGSVEPPDSDAVEVDPTGRYIRYEEILGKGAFKTVYKAFDDVEGIEVAWNQIKIDEVLQSNEDMERVHSEVQLLKQLKHENIMKFCSSWIDEHQRTINIITELFSSGSLRQYRLKHKKVDMKVIKRWAKQILAGLNYLHSHQPPIIHRDLKCDNIFINGNRGEIKLGDLGFATIMQQSNCRSVIGTPEFMAPELYDEQYNELVDIYSFGMCILELVTFEYPYSECRNSAQIFKKVSTGIKPAALAKVKDPEVMAFIEKCIAPAEKRFSAKALLMDPFLQTEILPQSLSNSSGVQHVLQEVNLLKDGEPEVIALLNNDDDGSPTKVVAQKTLYNRMFVLMGERREGNSLSLSLRIESDGHLEREMHVLFYLDNNSAPTTGDIVDRFGLIDQNGKCLSRLVDIILVHLIPMVDLPTKSNEMQSCYSVPTSAFSSVTSFHNLFEPAESLNYYPPEFVEDDKAQPIKVDDAIPLEMESLSISPTDDDASIISMEVHDDKSSVMCNSMMESMMTCMSADEAFSISADDDDDDNDVRMELGLIDFQYREALNEINERRLKAIEMVKSRAAQRKRGLS